MTGEASEIPVQHLQEPTSLPNDEKITLGERTLVVSPEVRHEMKALDRFVSEREIVAETFGWGLTRPIDDKTERLIEFVAPEPSKVFVMNSLFLSQDQNRLMQLLAGSSSLSMKVTDDGVALVPNNDEDTETWLRFPNKNGIQWGMSKGNVEELVGFELPDDITSLTAQLNEQRQKQEGAEDVDGLALRTDWELVLSGGSAIITEHFFERVNQLAKEKEAKINFTMHHHPNLGLAVWALEGKGLRERQEYYQRLLHFSAADLRSMANAGIDFFEIRALGNPQNPGSSNETTNRTYSVQEIVRESSQLGELIRKVIEPQTDDDTPEVIGRLGQQLNAEVVKLVGRDYPIKSLVEYYLGSDEYRQLKRELSDKRDKRSNKDLVLYHLLNTDEDKPLPTFTAELFQAREETGIVTLATKVGELYQQGGDTRAMVERTISDGNISDLFWITTSTDAKRVREVADKARVLFRDYLVEAQA